jgi:hypothetical protein
MILAGAAMLPSTTASAQANDTRNSFVRTPAQNARHRASSRHISVPFRDRGLIGPMRSPMGVSLCWLQADRVATLVLPQIGKAVALTDEMLAPLVEFGGQVQAIPLDRPWTIDASIGSRTGTKAPQPARYCPCRCPERLLPTRVSAFTRVLKRYAANLDGKWPTSPTSRTS